MNEALCSILCREERWTYHESDNRFIKFNKDGSGEVCTSSVALYHSSLGRVLTLKWKLWCRVGLPFFIAAELEWKSLSPPQPDEIVEAAGARWTRKPHFMGQLNLEITLTKRLAPGLPSWLAKGVNDYRLFDDAFRTKRFTARIERGNFKEPSWAGFGDEYESLMPRYALRLLFDKSPYPPRDEWKKPEEGPDGNDFWDHVEFVGRSSPELKKEERAMNDVNAAGWARCVMS